MHEALFEMNCKREKLGISWREIATRLHKDVATVTRQYTDESNPTIDTLEQLAAVLGGAVHFLPADWQERIHDLEKAGAETDLLRADVVRLEKENEMLRDRIATEQELLDARLQKIDQLQDMLERVINKLIEKV